jgi:hypothetical protein
MMVRGARCMKVYGWCPTRARAENGVPKLPLGNEGGNGGGEEACPTQMAGAYLGAMSPLRRAAMIRAAI